MASITLSWAANPATDNITDYQVYGANGTGVAFGSCALLATVSALTWTDAALPNSQARTYYIVAQNAAGSSAPDGPLNISTAAPSSVYIQNAGGAVSIAEGTHAARPAAGTAGLVYIETDTKTVWRDNGASWDQVGSSGGGSSGGGISIPGMDGADGDDGFAIPGPPGPAGAAGPSGALSMVYEDATVPGGNTIANTTTPAAFTSSYTIPANSLAVGSVIRVKLYGIYSTAIAPPTLSLTLALGGTTILASGAVTMVGSLTNNGWWADALLTVTAIGASGTVEAQGYAEFSTAATTGLSLDLTNTAAIGSVDTTGTLALTVTAQWSAASASNSIQLREMIVEVMQVGASGAGGGVETLISEVVTSGSQTTVTFSSIPATYRDLELRIRGRTTSASNENILIQYNGDSGANYDQEYGNFVVATTSAGNGIGVSGLTVAGGIAGGTTAANYADATIIDIMDYRGTTFYKESIHRGTIRVGGNTYTFTGSGWWKNTAAITSVLVGLSSGSFVDNSVVSLYGRL